MQYITMPTKAERRESGSVQSGCSYAAGQFCGECGFCYTYVDTVPLLPVTGPVAYYYIVFPMYGTAEGIVAHIIDYVVLFPYDLICNGPCWPAHVPDWRLY